MAGTKPPFEPVTLLAFPAIGLGFYLLPKARPRRVGYNPLFFVRGRPRWVGGTRGG